MTDQLDSVLRRLVKSSSADAALVWCRSGRDGDAIVLAGHPVTVPPGGMPCTVPAGATMDAISTTPFVPEPVLRQLPGAPAVVRSVALGADLLLTVVWFDQNVSTDPAWPPGIPEQVAAVAALSRDLHFADAEVERLRAAVNGLQDGIVTLNHGLGLAAVNRAAAALLDLPQGRNPLPAFDTALDRLAARALNRTEIDHCRSLLVADPSAAVDCMWRFPTEPTHLFVVSRPVEHQHFRGRTWVFYDESESCQALESLERAHAQLRASADSMLDPQALLQAVRGPDGRIVDFVFRDVNRATCTYLSMPREQLVGRTLRETMPNLKPSGLLARYAQCVETREPLVIDEVRYDNELLDGPRDYDIRGTAAGTDFLTLTWRDVTERVQSAHRIARSEQHFRLLAENVGDVVMHIRDGIIAWVSPSVEGALGAPPDHWIGRPLLELIPEEDQRADEKVTWLSDDRAVIPRGRLTGIDGQTHWVHVHARTLHDANGHRDGYTASFRVIDEEVHAVEQAEVAQQRQAQADARYRRLMDSSAVPMCVTEPGGRFEEVNQAACDFFGYDAETFRQMTWQELTAPDYLEADLLNVEKMAAGRIDSFRSTKQFIHADGHLIWGDLSVGCLRRADGALDRLIAQVRDITMEVEARRYLARRDEQNRILTARLQAQTDRLRAELRSAAAYVESILPSDLDGPVGVRSRYLPSRELGGDCFDYRWVDDDHLIVYIIDVSGHGIGASLVSISVHNLLRSAANLLDPAAVLARLNTLFTMERHSDNYLTAWYGVYQRSSRTLRYACGGHPPGLLFTPGGEVTRLGTDGFPVGMFTDGEFGSATCTVPAGSQLLLYSDGVYELPTPDNSSWSLEDFVRLSGRFAQSPDWSLDTLIDQLKARTDTGHLDDDCSIVRVTFN